MTFSVNAMINDQLAVRAATAFSQVTLGRWGHPRTEIQDGGTFVLLSVDVPHFNANEVDSKVRESVANALNEILPTHPGQTIGSWLVVFLREGQVCESISPSGF